MLSYLMSVSQKLSREQAGLILAGNYQCCPWNQIYGQEQPLHFLITRDMLVCQSNNYIAVSHDRKTLGDCL